MFKKKLSILLLLSLAVLFIGSFSTTYARSLSSTEIKNAIKNFYQEKINSIIPSYDLDHINNVDLSGWVDVISRYQGKYIILFSKLGSRVITSLYCYSGSSIYLTTQNGENAIGTISGTLFSSTFDTQNTSVGAWNNSPIQQIPYTWAYFESGITKNSNTNAYNIQPYTYIPNSNIFNSSYGTDIFRFVRNTNLQYVNDNNIAIVTSGDILGYIELGQNYGAVEVSCNYWDKVRNSWVEFYWFANSNNSSASQVNIYIRDLINSSNNNIFPNVLVQTTYHSNDTDKFDTDYMQPFIISDSHTVISGDTFSPTDTFDDDSYYNDYINTINSIKDKDNTDKITDTLTDDSQVDNIIGSYLSGDIDTYAHDFGFTPLDNPFTTFLLYVLEGTYDTLTRSGNITLSANYKNVLDFELRSQDFITPDSPLKSFLRMMLITWYLYGNYKFFHYLITLAETAKIDRAVAELGTDEFYDTDIM